MTHYHLRFDPGLLVTFLTVADHGRVSAAATTLHLSQPTVTAQIHKLEQGLQVALFLRSATGVTLTPVGQRFYDQARRAYDLLEEASWESTEAPEAQGTLELAASTTAAAHILPPVMAAFQKRYRQIRFRLVVGNTADVVGWVREGRFPLGMVEGLERAAPLRLERFIDDEIVVVCAPRFVHKVRTAADLATVPIVWRESGSGTRAIVDRALRASSLGRRKPSDDMEVGHTEAIKAAVAAGMGLGFLSQWSIQAELALGRLVVVPVADLVIKRTFHWALPAGPAVGLADLFQRFAAQHPPVMAG